MFRRYGPERRVARLARYPACLVQVFRVYKQCANSNDVAMQKQGGAIVGRHALVIATPLDSHPHKGRIFLAGRHQGTCRLAWPGLHYIGLVTSRYRVICQSDTCQSTDVQDSLLLMSLPSSNPLESVTQGGKGRECQHHWCSLVMGKLDNGHAFELGYIGLYQLLRNTEGKSALTYG